MTEDEKKQKVLDAIARGDIEFAGSTKVDQYPEIERKFMEQVMDCRSYFITDSSMLSDFSFGELKAVREDCLKVFKIDIEPVLHGYLWEVFEFIDQKQKLQ